MRLTNRATVRHLCGKYGFTLAKGFGQNFLVNPGVCPKICDAAQLEKADSVLEIGPGFGTLTQALAQRAGRVLALEVDARLLPVLAETLADCPNATVRQGDVMRENLAALLENEFGAVRAGRAEGTGDTAGTSGGPLKLCANLPYNLTSPILMRILEEQLPFSSITVMVQKEAALRLAAAPGTREAGAITYAVHYYTVPRLNFTVSPGSFTPPPKVQSAVITLTPRKTLPLAGQPAREKRLFRLVRAAFGQRRKTLANAACAGLGLPKTALQAALAKAGLAPAVRPEELTLEQYIDLEALLEDTQ